MGMECPAELRALAEDPEVHFVAHNAGFEKDIWRNILVKFYGWPDVPDERWDDTMAACAMKCVPFKLEHACITLRLPFQKDTVGSKLTKALSKPNRKGYYDWTEEKLDRSLVYNASDIHAQASLHNRLGPLPPGERKVWLLDQRINERGFRLDLPLVHNMRQIVDGATAPLAEEFKQLTGGLEFTQIKKLKEWCHDEGASIPSLGKEVIAQWLGGDPDDPDFERDPGAWVAPLPERVDRALRIRQLIGSASVGKLPKIEGCVCEDGRARRQLQYHAAGPGRWAGRLIQPQNFPRGTNELIAMDVDEKVAALMTGDWEYIETVYGQPVEFVVGSLRHTIIPMTNYELAVGDFAGIEARVVLALAGQHDKCELLASGVDAYIDMAFTIDTEGKLPRGDLKDKVFIKNFKEHYTAERQTGKNSVLGCGFQMGGPKFKLRYAPEMSDEAAAAVIRAYREDWAPLVPKLWKALERAVIRTVHEGKPTEAYGIQYALEDGWLTARLPSGRKLWYWNPTAIRKEMQWSTPEEPDIRPAVRVWMRKGGHMVPVDLYGGLLTENVVQAIARDLLVTAMFKCERNGLPIVLTVHDEIVSEPLSGAHLDSAKTLQHIMEDIPEWARAIKVPVLAECWTGDRYRK
jgi:DNA polymerase